jgi:hypothetical protein
MERSERLSELREYGRMEWLDRAQGWRAEPDEVVSALAADGFQECKREIARVPRGGGATGGVWQGVDHRTGAVASTIWVREATTGSPIVFISINGESVNPESQPKQAERRPDDLEGGS